MDPTQFHIDWAVLGEVLGTIIVLAFFVERALSLVFEHRGFIARFDKKGVKEPIAFAVALGTVVFWQFDALSILLSADKNSWVGYVLTAAVIAGGSKASIALFHDLMNARSSILKESSAATARKTKTKGKS